MSRPSTLHDVAAVVGVSPRTVSRVVNDQGGFSEATRVRVMEAVNELRYRPNLMARGLITRRSDTVAFIAPVLDDPFFAEVAESVHRAARAAGLTMLLALTGGDVDTELEVLAGLEPHAPDGLIIFPSGESIAHLTPGLDRGTRIVVIDTPSDHPNAASIMSDLSQGARLAVERLVSRGCTQLAMIASNASPVGHRPRESGFRDSLPESMVVLVESADPTIEGGRAAAAVLIEHCPTIDGIFTYNDDMAIGAMKAVRAAGRSIPDDVAIIGCNDTQMAAVVTPALTSLRIDRERLGREAVSALVALRDGSPTDSPVILPVELVFRESG